MNNRLVLSLINRRHRPHQGFAFAMSMMIGMVILVVAAAMLIRGQEDQNKVVSQTAKNIANAAAEAGLTRVINFVKNNPATAAYHMENWSNATMMTAAVTKTTTPTTSSGVDTVNTTNFCSLPSPTPTPSGSSANNTTSAIATEVSQITGTSGQSLNTGDTGAMSPRFRLEQYVYDSTTGTAQVRVAGFAGNPDSPKAKTNLVATIPVGKTQETVTVTSGVLLPSAFPSLWIKEVSSTDLDNVYSDVLGPCGTKPTAGIVSGTNTLETGRRYIQSPQEMPTPPTTPTTNIVNLGSNLPDGETFLPRQTDIDNPTNLVNGRYQYTVSEIDWSNGPAKKLTFRPGYKVSLFVAGNINPKNHTIRLDCGSTSGCNATDAMIIGSPTNTTGQLDMQGNPEMCNLFVWAPTYTGYLGGGGGGGVNCEAPPDAKGSASSNRGIYWLKNWNSNSNGASHVAFSDQNPNLWPTITNVVNNLATNDIPATSSTTTTYTKIALRQPTAWSMKDSDYVVTVPSGTVVGYETSTNNTQNTTNNTQDTTNNTQNTNEDKKCTMPNLVGTSTTGKTADTLLEAVKAALTNFTGTPTGTATTTGDNTIQTQTPAATTQVDCGTQVTFTYKLSTQRTVNVSNENDCNKLKGTYYHSGNTKTCTYYD